MTGQQEARLADGIIFTPFMPKTAASAMAARARSEEALPFLLGISLLYVTFRAHLSQRR